MHEVGDGLVNGLNLIYISEPKRTAQKFMQ